MNKNIVLMVISLFLFTLSIFIAPAPASESIQEIQFIGENSPPFNYIEDDKIKGIFVEVLIAVSKQMESALSWDRISVLPGDRAYQSLLAGGKKCLFGMTRTKERESLFRWAGPVTHNRIVLIAKTGSDIHINSTSRIRSVKTGVIKGDISEKILLESELPPESLFYAFGDNAAMEILQTLGRGMIDLWAQGEMPARWLIKNQSLNPRDYKTVYVLKDTEVCFAFSKDVSNGFVGAFQRALDRVMKKGAVKKIIKAYLSEEIHSF